MVVIQGRRKHERRVVSDRRSNYIGVSKNGPNWQSMISLNKKKAYIGTYQEEKDAALSFDFYAILIHGLNAKTNFTYNKSQILSMIF